MECSRNLEVTLISAEGLKNGSCRSKSNVYAVVSISGSHNKKFKTPVDKSGGLEPRWNHRMNFTIDEAAGLQNRLTLLVKIKSAGMLSDKNLGEVRVSMKELLEGIKDERKAIQLVIYQMTGKSNKPRGTVVISYEFGERFFKPVKASSHGFGVGSKSVSGPRNSRSSSGCGDCCCPFMGDDVVSADVDAGNHHGCGCGGCACGGCDCGGGCTCGGN